jgi:hypothetical protein
VPVITILFGAALTALGVVSYTGAVEYFGSKPYSSVTALIPAFVGVPLILCGLIALNERYLKHAMHAAAAVGLLGLLGALGRAGPSLPVAFREGEAGLQNPSAFHSVVAMAVLCGVFVGLCVNSFIAARRRRARAEMPR